VIARHTALEITVDKRLNLSETGISIPYNFVLNKLILHPDAQQVGLNPLIQHYVSLYWEKYPSRNDKVPILDVPTYDAEWFRDLGADLSLAVVSAPAMCVVAGPAAAVAAFRARADAAGISLLAPAPPVAPPPAFSPGPAS